MMLSSGDSNLSIGSVVKVKTLNGSDLTVKVISINKKYFWGVHFNGIKQKFFYHDIASEG